MAILTSSSSGISLLYVSFHALKGQESPHLVDKHARELKISAFDKVDTFLMYDMDVPSINTKLRACKAQLLLSNPCFEIWLLLHAKDQRTGLSSDAVIKGIKEKRPCMAQLQQGALY